MEFYKTVMGKCFFDIQLPKLIGALEDISTALLQKPTQVTLPAAPSKNYLEELYYGNLEIGAFSAERYTSDGMQEIILLQEELKATLTQEQWELFMKYNTMVNNRSSDETCRLFQHGFRLAVNLIAAGLQESHK